MPFLKKSQIIDIVRELQSPKAFARAQKNPVEFFAKYGIKLPANMQYEIHRDDEKLMNFVLPFDSAKELDEDQLNWVVAAENNPKFTTVSSVGSLSTVGSIYTEWSASSAITTAGSASTLSTVGTLGTASSVDNSS